MLHLEHTFYSRWLKSVFPAWGITAFKDYYDSFMHTTKQTNNNNNNNKKPTTAKHPNPLFVSLNGLHVNAKQKSQREVKCMHCKQQQIIIPSWCLLQSSR